MPQSDFIRAQLICLSTSCAFCSLIETPPKTDPGVLRTFSPKIRLHCHPPPCRRWEFSSLNAGFSSFLFICKIEHEPTIVSPRWLA
ncbi:hypothetical protein PNOK_0392400 [Pyrrhoderma noxium]|uniref:Uncharacterized protein n=1 Tax=Pyrrhoderma noxium TaxID=2282107 RepID=A0A286UNW8_9AGAM|nr:hypothetical protein PNOK_0392400 [Pyrrhoderma noxium]